jgi:hypothetical protein
MFAQIVSMDWGGFICKRHLVSPSSTPEGRAADPLRGAPRPLRVECY